METDSFFWQLLKKLPETLFALVGLSPKTADQYRFDALEIKKSYRHDGVCVPTSVKLPVCFVEVQYRRRRHCYANLFAKVFSFLDANNPDQDWIAAVLFPSHSAEPKPQPAYEDLLASPRVRRIFLDELKVPKDATAGLRILQLVSAPAKQSRELVSNLLEEARKESDCERASVIVELME